MRLLELFLLKWEKSNLKEALKWLQDEIENRYGVLSDEDKIEKVFFESDKHGNMSEKDSFTECMEAFSFIKDMKLIPIPLKELIEELSGWKDSIEAERLERAADETKRSKLERLIGRINEIACKKRLVLLKEKGTIWHLEESCDLSDYENGRRTFSDMHVRALLLRNISESIRVLVIADSENGDCCIEI